MSHLPLPPLAALRAFSAFVQTGSVTGAGDALNVSHAAISQQMRNLETHLGLALFDRSGRKLVLTDDGHHLARAVTDGFGTIARAVEALTGAEADRPLHVTTTPNFAANWLMPRLAGFQAAQPDVHIMVDATSGIRNFGEGGLDVAIRYGAGGWRGVETEFLWPSPVVLVGAPSLVGDTPADRPEALVQFPWLQELGSSEASQWLAEHGVPDARLRAVIQVPGNLMLDGARSGQGLAITARIAVEADIDAGRLRVLHEDPPGKGYYLVTNRGVARPPLRAFLAWVRREALAWQAQRAARN